MKVFEGTQSYSTQAPPSPSGSTSVTSAPCCAATKAASYPAGPPPMITMRVTSQSPPSASWATNPPYAGRIGPCPGPPVRISPVQPGATAVRADNRRDDRYPERRAVVRRLRVQHGSRPDDEARPALADVGDRLADGLAADL